jgi:hypothetical protein
MARFVIHPLPHKYFLLAVRGGILNSRAFHPTPTDAVWCGDSHNIL